MNTAKLPFARSFRELVAYQKQRELAREVFQVSKRFPPEEKFSLTDQVRRAARSIGAQLAEAWAKRRYERHFISKLTDADGEQMETQHWLETACADGYLQPDVCAKLVGHCEEIGRMLGRMINGAASFCGDAYVFHEPAAEYFCSITDSQDSANATPNTEN